MMQSKNNYKKNRTPKKRDKKENTNKIGEGKEWFF